MANDRLTLDVAKLRALLIDWHLDDEVDMAQAGDYAMRLIARMRDEAKPGVSAQCLKKFQATGRDCLDLDDAIGGECYEDENAGRIYAGNLYIAKRGKAWGMVIIKDEYESNDLSEMERVLCAYAIENMVIDENGDPID